MKCFLLCTFLISSVAFAGPIAPTITNEELAEARAFIERNPIKLLQTQISPNVSELSYGGRKDYLVTNQAGKIIGMQSGSGVTTYQLKSFNRATNRFVLESVHENGEKTTDKLILSLYVPNGATNAEIIKALPWSFDPPSNLVIRNQVLASGAPPIKSRDSELGFKEACTANPANLEADAAPCSGDTSALLGGDKGCSDMATCAYEKEVCRDQADNAFDQFMGRCVAGAGLVGAIPLVGPAGQGAISGACQSAGGASRSEAKAICGKTYIKCMMRKC